MGINSLIDSSVSIAKRNPVATSVVGGGIVGASGLGALAIAKRKRKKKSNRKYSRKKSFSRRSRRGRRTPRTAGKGKDRSTKRIRYTKNGQPYVIMASGKARFIKKKGARRSHRRKGGRY